MSLPLTYPDDDVSSAVHTVLVYLRSHKAPHNVHQLVVVFITHLIIIIIFLITITIITYWYWHQSAEVVTKCIVEWKIKL